MARPDDYIRADKGSGPTMSSADMVRDSVNAPNPTASPATGSGLYARGTTAASNAAKALMGFGEGQGTMKKLAGRAGAAVAPAIEALDVAKVAQDPQSSGIDVATQAAQGAGRVGAAIAGAGAGAVAGSAIPVAGTAAGALLGGYLGYKGADKAIEMGRGALGSDPSAPADRASWNPSTTAATVAAPKPAAPVIAPISESAGGAGRGFGYDAPFVAGTAAQQLGGVSGRNMTAELNKVPNVLPADMRDGVVVKTVGPDGRSTYSGRNVGTNADGQTQMVDGTGKDIKMLGPPKGNFVQALDDKGKPTSFATPDSGGAIDFTGKNRYGEHFFNSGGGTFSVVPAYPVRDAQGITAQSHAAADSLSNQSTARVQLAMGQERYKQEVAEAQRINKWVAARFNPPTRGEARARNLAMKEREIDGRLDNERRRLDQGDEHFQATSNLNERKFGVDAAGASVDQQLKGTQAASAAQLLKAQQGAIDPSASPEGRRKAYDTLMALQGKQADDYQVIHAAGGQQLDAKGNVYKTPDRIIKYSKRSGNVEEVAAPSAQQPSPYRDGQVLRGKDGKNYVVKNGQPVPQ